MDDRMALFKTLLKERGLKSTSQRTAILKVLMDQPEQHFTAEEIYDLVRTDWPDIGLATVYRNIQLLSDMHLIDKLNLDDGYVRYEIADMDTETVHHHHHHMICRKCGKVLAFGEDLLQIVHCLLVGEDCGGYRCEAEVSPQLCDGILDLDCMSDGGKVGSGSLVLLPDVAFCNGHVPQVDDDVDDGDLTGAPLNTCVTGAALPELVGAENLFLKSKLSHSDDLPGPVGGPPSGRASCGTGTTLEAHLGRVCDLLRDVCLWCNHNNRIFPCFTYI